MQTRWLRHSGASDLIVLFGGWALGAAPFEHLAGDQDVLFVDDFRDLGELPDLSAYAHKAAVTYSFGVAAFCHFSQRTNIEFNRRVAVNGSHAPVDRKLGIPPVIFDKTADTLSDVNFQSFLALCHGSEQPHQSIEVAARQEELWKVKERGSALAPAFDRIWISTADRIFPTANLKRAWADQANVITEIDAPHVPFALWSNWSEVLS